MVAAMVDESFGLYAIGRWFCGEKKARGTVSQLKASSPPFTRFSACAVLESNSFIKKGNFIHENCDSARCSTAAQRGP